MGRGNPPKGSRGKRPSTHLPTRSRRGSYLTVTGKFPSSKSTHMVAFEGLRERDFFVVLEYDEDVESFQPHPVRLQYKVAGRSRVYTPDVLVRYRSDPRGQPVRRHELCEVKTGLQLRKDWRDLRERFRAAQRHCRTEGWRFRLVHEPSIPRPFVGTLHFLLAYRELDEDPGIAAASREALVTFGPLSVAALVERLAQQDNAPDDVITQVWRLVGLGQLRVDFEKTLGMKSVVRLQPWCVRDVIHELRVRARSRRHEGSTQEAFQPSPAGELIGSAGSSVMPLEVGLMYGRHDSRGAWRIVHFTDPENAVVQEPVTGALETVATNVLAPLSNRAPRGRAELMVATSKERETAEARFRAIAPFVDQRRVSLAEAKDAADTAGVSLTTWRAWRAAYQRNPTLSSLMRRRRNDSGKGRLDPVGEAILGEFVNRWLDSTDSVKSVYKDMKDRVKEHNRANPAAAITAPSYPTFYNRCRALPPHQIVERREGKRIARLTHGLARGSIGGIDYPLSIVQIDHTPLPIQVVDAEYGIPIGRPTITVMIDLYSRMVVGYYLTLDDPGDLSTGMAITNAMLPKAETLSRFDITVPWPCSGRMRTIHVDNAGEFHGNMLELGCKEYSIELVFRKVKQPNYGGHIESYLGTLSERLRKLPGATLTGPYALGDRDPQAEAKLTLDDVERWFLWHLMEYHHSEHSGLQGQAPIDRWRDGFRGSSVEPGIGKVFQFSDPGKLRIDFLPLEERSVQPKGIVWDHIWYSDPSLQRWVNAPDPKASKLARQFICRRDPRDLGRIYFWDPEVAEYRVIPYRNPTRPAMTLWEFKQVRKYLIEQGRSHIDEDILFEARTQRRRILEDAVTQSQRKRQAREREQRRLAEEQAAIVRADIGVAPTGKPDTSPSSLLSEDEIEPFES